MKILLILLITSFSIFTQQTKLEPYDNLPLELKNTVVWKNILSFIRPSNGILNLPALAKELQNLAKVNKETYSIVNDGRFMLAVLKSLPGAAALYLASGLRNMPGIKSGLVQSWLKTIQLARGKELYAAVFNNNAKKVADILKDPNIDVNWKNTDGEIDGEKDGRTALMHSSSYANIEIVKLLLAAGANVNAQNKNNTTALMLAAERRNTEIAKLLLDSGANVNAQNKFGITALTAATANGHIETVKLLLDAGADINYQENIEGNGFTALMYAANNNYMNMVKLLLASNANIVIKNKDGESAKDIAQKMGYNDIVKILDDALKMKSLKEQSAKKVAERIKAKTLTFEQAKKILPTDLHPALEKALKEFNKS